ncbi:MAG: hypothetical protein Q4C87_02375 [Actinomycetaceae bacterium]|nr:hypothetical protein [Actinomycetaceae bacterium]
MFTPSFSGSTDHNEKAVGTAAAKPLNIMGIIGLIILIISDVIRPLYVLVFASGEDLGPGGILIAPLFALGAFLLSLVALLFAVIGVKQKETRARWVAIAVTALVVWNSTFFVYDFVVYSLTNGS